MSSAGRDMFMGAAAIALIVFGGWLHHVIGTPRHDAYRQTAIANAVSEALENNRDTLTCKDNAMLQTIRSLAENGAHVSEFSFDLWINIGDEGESIGVPDGG